MRGIDGMILTGENLSIRGGGFAVEANRTEYKLCGYRREGKLVPVVKHRSMNTVWGKDLFIYLFVGC